MKFYLCNKEFSKKLKFKEKLTWKNKALYIYNLYMYLLKTLLRQLNAFKEKSKYIDAKDSNKYKYKYKYLKNLLDVESDEHEKQKLIENIQNINFLEGEFFDSYIKYFRDFLININSNLKKKFENNKFTTEEDQTILEDLIVLF